MQNNLFTPSPVYSRGDKLDVTTLGGINKTNRILLANKQREAVESKFMRISLKANRAERQQEERRNKRK